MNIHWFPGHMATALGEIKKVMPQADLVLEVLDARIPFSSANPKVAELRGEKPCIRILNKSDLADPEITAEWIEWIEGRGERERGVRALAHAHGQRGDAKKLVELARSMARVRQAGPTVAIIVGIPNAGKSTLINALAGRSIAKAANKPAVTQAQQRVQIARDLVLLDTPGVLWPKLTPEVCGYRLAVTGALSDRVADFEDLASFAARFLRERYPNALATHYGLDSVPGDESELFEAIGKRRGFLVKGGGVDLAKVTTLVVRDFRAGQFGRLSLERPSHVEREADEPAG